MKRQGVEFIIGKVAMAGVLILGGAQSALAQSNAVASGDWSDPLTWGPAEPVTGALATINGGLTVGVTAAGEAVGTLDLGTISGQTGNVTVASGAELTASGGDLPSIRVGQAAGATGSLTVNGGLVSVIGPLNDSGFAIGDLLVGDVGNGTLTQTAGNVSANDEIVIALGGASTASVDVSGGTFETNADGRSILVGFGGDGTLKVSGTATVRANHDLLVGFLEGSKGRLQQSGGVIEAGFLFTNRLSGGAGSTATVDMTGGTFNTRIAYVLGQGNGTTTANHSGGTINVPVNGEFVIGDGPNNSSTYNISGTADVNIGRNLVAGRDGIGVINMSGGTIDATNVFLGDFDSSYGTLKMSGGVLTLTGNLSVGGALASNAGSFPPGHALDANGTLIVSGTGGTIDVGGNLLANPLDNPRVGGGGERNSALLGFEVASGGVSMLDVTGVADLTGAEIDVDLLSAFPTGSTFDLLTATDISADYLQVAEDVGRFSLAIVAGGNGEILRATVVPEPATLALAMLGVVLGLHVRKQR